jgi:hypothetical protein
VEGKSGGELCGILGIRHIECSRYFRRTKSKETKAAIKFLIDVAKRLLWSQCQYEQIRRDIREIVPETGVLDIRVKVKLPTNLDLLGYGRTRITSTKEKHKSYLNLSTDGPPCI